MSDEIVNILYDNGLLAWDTGTATGCVTCGKTNVAFVFCATCRNKVCCKREKINKCFFWIYEVAIVCKGCYRKFKGCKEKHEDAT